MLSLPATSLCYRHSFADGHVIRIGQHTSRFNQYASTQGEENRGYANETPLPVEKVIGFHF